MDINKKFKIFEIPKIIRFDNIQQWHTLPNPILDAIIEKEVTENEADESLKKWLEQSKTSH